MTQLYYNFNSNSTQLATFAYSATVEPLAGRLQ
jgi:hypothetical protein